MATQRQPDFFDGGNEAAATPSRFPDGFRYETGLIDRAAEDALLGHLQGLPFRAFEFRGYTGKRRVVSFGWEYHFGARHLRAAGDIPAFLHPLRAAAAAFARRDPESFQHVLVTEYAPGAGIGWHRDKDVFGEVVGISLRAPCAFRLRRRAGDGWDRVSLKAEPRSAYLLSGEVRAAWEHSIPPVESLRYSITFRTLGSA